MKVYIVLETGERLCTKTPEAMSKTDINNLSEAMASDGVVVIGEKESLSIVRGNEIRCVQFTQD